MTEKDLMSLRSDLKSLQSSECSHITLAWVRHSPVHTGLLYRRWRICPAL